MQDALSWLLQGDGEVRPEEDQGPEMAIDLVLFSVANVDAWVRRVVRCLQDWQVPEGTALSVTVYPAAGGFKHWRVEIPVQ